MLESNGPDDFIWCLRTQDATWSVKLAIAFAEAVIDKFESKYPNDKRPREAINAAKVCINETNTDAYSAAAAAADARAAAAAYADYAAAAAAAAAADDAAAAAAAAAAYADYAAAAAYDAAYAAAYTTYGDAAADADVDADAYATYAAFKRKIILEVFS